MLEMNATPLLFGTVEEQVSRYKDIINAMPTGVILLDPQGRIAEANGEAYRLLGEPLESERWLDVITRAFSPQGDDGHEISLKDGRKVKLAISALELGQLIVITDMTETRLLQSRISDLQRLSSIGKMVASLAHQVRTPLSSALLYAENLGVNALPSQVRNDFQKKLLSRLYDLEKQVNDMLLFANGGNNKVIDRFVLGDLLDEFEPMVEALLHSHDVNFSVNSPDESIYFLGNVNALASALSNLVINAIQVAGQGCKIMIDTRQIEGELFISVIDDGPGIPNDLLEKITEPFFTTRQQGTGLGLAVVQMVCNAHRGRLRIQSDLGHGACFTLCLPLSLNTQEHNMEKQGCTKAQC